MKKANTLLELAVNLMKHGKNIEEVRTELRGTILSCGDSPTCSAVEEVIKNAQHTIPYPAVTSHRECEFCGQEMRHHRYLDSTEEVICP